MVLTRLRRRVRALIDLPRDEHESDGELYGRVVLPCVCQDPSYGRSRRPGHVATLAMLRVGRRDVPQYVEPSVIVGLQPAASLLGRLRQAWWILRGDGQLLDDYSGYLDSRTAGQLCDDLVALAAAYNDQQAPFRSSTISTDSQNPEPPVVAVDAAGRDYPRRDDVWRCDCGGGHFLTISQSDFGDTAYATLQVDMAQPATDLLSQRLRLAWTLLEHPHELLWLHDVILQAQDVPRVLRALRSVQGSYDAWRSAGREVNAEGDA